MSLTHIFWLAAGVQLIVAVALSRLLPLWVAETTGIAVNVAIIYATGALRKMLEQARGHRAEQRR
ncbi:MAG: hypothetical protein IMW98_08615 [Firmicutes bacterium]|nr:hypothetical protein [Bacillota bacterium]MBE3590868.1 hypothetical protein [Bacillota bacterium]